MKHNASLYYCPTPKSADEPQLFLSQQVMGTLDSITPSWGVSFLKSSMRSPTRPPSPIPLLFESSSTSLGLDSTLSDLPLHQFQVPATWTGEQLAQVFEQHPSLPGAVLLEGDQFLGLISRQRFLEALIRPHGLELFLSKPLRVLHSYVRSPHLTLPPETPILAAAQMALRRSPDQRGEPVLVEIDPCTNYLLDAHELNVAHWQLRGIETQVRYERMQAQMIQIEKMASLGRLVDGVAHEILDPVGFIWGNLTHVSTYTEQLQSLLVTYEAEYGVTPTIQQLQEDIELDYLKADLPRTIDSIRAGAERLKRLASSLQNFCHIDEVYPRPSDLHECLDSLILLLKTRLTGEIQIVRNYGHLPPVNCYLGQISQVLMNILTNAVDALLNQAVQQEWEQSLGRKPTPGHSSQLVITTRVLDGVFASRIAEAGFTALSDSSSQPKPLPQSTSESFKSTAAPRYASICIADNGPGLSPEQVQRIMSAFSVEQRVEKETSLGMSYRIVTAKHGGRLLVRSHKISASEAGAVAQGTEFEILLPLGQG